MAMTCNITKLLALGMFVVLALILTGFGTLMAARQPEATLVPPGSGFVRSLGPKIALAQFNRTDGRCAITLTIADAPGRADRRSSARLRISLAPAEAVELAGSDSLNLTLICGAGGRSLSAAVASNEHRCAQRQSQCATRQV
jgi:hypothetical protein